MQKRRLTDRFLQSLTPGPSDVRIADDKLAGFGILVRAGGRISYYFDGYGADGRRSRAAFGRFPHWPVEKARALAQDLRQKVDRGGSLRAAPAEETVNGLLPKWIESVEMTRRGSTADKYDAHAERFISPTFGTMPPRAITTNMVESWHAKIGKNTRTQANRCLATMSAFMTWCRRAGLCAANPCSDVKRFGETPRSVYLDSVELGVAEELLMRHERRSAGLTIALQLLTGARIGECVGVRDHVVDLTRANWVKPASSTKQKREHRTPLPSRAVDVLKELLPLDPPTDKELRRVLADLRSALGRPEVKLHDLRHSRASALARSGASLPMIGKLLGHSAPQTTARYAHLHHDDLREVLEASTQEPTPLRKRA